MTVARTKMTIRMLPRDALAAARERSSALHVSNKDWRRDLSN
jgi:hypothetical protein